MQTFTYSLSYRIIYRFGNLPVSLLLFLVLISAVTNLSYSLFNIIPILITATLIYILNRQYLLLYKILPLQIEADKEKMVCSRFVTPSKKITIYYKNVASLEGGVFEGKTGGLMKIRDGQNQITVGLFNNIKNAKNLQTLILTYVRREVYDDVLKKINEKKKPAEKLKSKK
jgi:hypothetical protein